MALVIEDGSGVAGAESYVSVAEADAYLGDRGRLNWAAQSEAAREQALRRAVDVLDVNWSYIGVRAGAAQALAWPRSGAVKADGSVVDGVPGEIRRAQFELAAKAIEGELLPDEVRGGQVRRRFERVDQIEQSVTYEPGAPAGTVFVLVERLLAEVIAPSSDSTLIERG